MLKLLGALVFLAVAVSVLFVARIVYTENKNRSPEMFQAWKHQYPSSQVSYDEWRKLYDADLLQGQKPQPEVVPMPIFIYH